MEHSERTAIRAVEEGDLGRLRSWRNDPRVWKSSLGRRFPILETGERAWFDSLNAGAFPSRVVWAVADGSGEAVGVTQLDDLDWIHRTASFGIWIAPEHWGVGHASRATALVCEFGLVDLGLRQIRLRVLAQHEVAKRVYQKNGFRNEAVLGGAVLVGGTPQDLEIMVRTDGDVPSTWPANGEST